MRAGQAYSHRGHGWEQLTDAAIHALSERPKPVVFILWGRAARNKKQLINTKTNIVLESAHPSPLSANRGFFGSRPFLKQTKHFRQWENSQLIGNCLPNQIIVKDVIVSHNFKMFSDHKEVLALWNYLMRLLQRLRDKTRQLFSLRGEDKRILGSCYPLKER